MPSTVEKTKGMKVVKFDKKQLYFKNFDGKSKVLATSIYHKVSHPTKREMEMLMF